MIILLKMAIDKEELRKHLIFFGIFLAMVGIEFAYRQPLFDRSI